MTLPDLFRFVPSALLAGAALVALPAKTATVIASAGPNASRHPVGSRVADTASLSLEANDSVTVLDARGTRVLRGPGTFPVSQPSGGNRTSVYAALVSNRATQRVRTGSVRNAPDGRPARSPNLWYVDISRPGTYCMTDPAAVRFWRGAAGEALTIEAAAAGGTQSIAFGAMDTVAPITGQIMPDAAYALRGKDGQTLGTVRFVRLENQPATMEDMAAALIAHDCTEQLATLDSAIRLPDN